MLARSHFAAFVHLFEREPLPGLPWLYKRGAGRLKGLKGCFCSSGSLRAQSARTGLSLTTILGAKPGWEPPSLYPKHTHTQSQTCAVNVVWPHLVANLGRNGELVWVRCGFVRVTLLNSLVLSLLLLLALWPGRDVLKWFVTYIWSVMFSKEILCLNSKGLNSGFN